MENTLNTRETAFALITSQVYGFDDLLDIQTTTGLDMAELERMYYSIL